MADNFDLFEGLCRFSTHSRGDIEELVALLAKEKQCTPSSLVELGILDFDEFSDRYAIVGSIKMFVDRLLQRRHLVDSRLMESAIYNLQSLRESLEIALRHKSVSRMEDLILNIRECVDSLHSSVEGNLEAIHRATEDYRKHPPRSSKDRWGRIRELWDNYVLPMQAIFMPHGPFDEVVTGLRHILDHAEDRAPQKLIDDFQLARYYLRRLSTFAFKAYQDAAHEVQPLYEQAKRNAQAALSASTLIASYYRQSLHQGVAPGEDQWDRWFGLMDPWSEDRLRKPFGTNIASWLAQVYYQRPPEEDRFVKTAPQQVRVPLSDKVIQKRFLQSGNAAPDLLLWLQQAFPQASLREILRGYHFLLKKTHVAHGGPIRVMQHPEALIRSLEVAGRGIETEGSALVGPRGPRITRLTGKDA